MAFGMAQSQPTMERNIVLIGKSGSGKSTLGNKLLRREAFATGDSPDPVTQNCSWARGNWSIGTTTLELNVLDTPGLQDSSCSNAAVLQKIILKAQLKTISAVIFVMKQGRIIDEVGMFNDISKRYRDQASSISALVITNCERGNRSTLEESFKTNYRTKNIAAFMELGIFLVGFPSSPILQQTLKANIQQDTHNMIRFIAGLDKKYNASAIFK